MGALAWIAGLIVAVGFAMAGMMKLTGQEMSLRIRDHLGVGEGLWQAIGVAEILGAVAVVIGLFGDGESYEWIGLVGALGLIALMVGALMHHQRAGDQSKDMAPPAMMAVLTIIYLIAYIGR